MSLDLTSAPASPAPTRARPELLAPAGDWECVRAAVENGADAIYFGLERFNARMRAKNFTQADLPALMEFLHRRGLRGYVTFNTLVFADELAAAEDYARTIIAAGVDAAIVQDVGICRMIRRLSPDFPIHCSTQMTITSAAGVAFARELGAQLVVLARENSLAEIAKIRADDALSCRTGSSDAAFETRRNCREAEPPREALTPPIDDGAAAPSPRRERGERASSPATPMPLEVFVHGALCVAYSGQCLTSEALGGRSANRGECAQACRLPYDLISDGKQVPLGDRRYLLSPQDLAGIEVLPELVAAGVASLKIEGRLKSAEYVASITRVYRAALNRVCPAASAAAGKAHPDSAAVPSPAHHASAAAPTAASARSPRYELEMSFSRGLYTGWFHGVNNQELAHARFGTKRGVFIGRILKVEHEGVWIELEAPLKPGDGIVFDAGKPDLREEGGRVYHIDPSGASPREVVLRFGHGDINWQRVHAGQRVWKTNDPALDRELRATYEGEKIRFQRPIGMEVHGRTGSPLTLIASDGEGHVVQYESAVPLAPATTQPLSTARLREQLSRLGGTPFKLGELHSFLEGDVMVPVSELNRLRREAVTALEELRARPKRWTLIDAPSAAQIAPPCALGVPDSQTNLRRTAAQATPAAELIAVIRLPEQLDAAWHAGVRTVYAEFENPKFYRDTVQRFRALQRTAAERPSNTARTPQDRSSIWVAAPRIFKPGEEWILQQVRSCEADGYLVRNYDHLSFFAPDRKRGDFSLNVSNPLTAEYFLERYGLERVTASYDLNVSQLEALLRTAPPAWFDITIHQHMPLFHMEHCVFCAFLSDGKDYRDCGRPCDTHRVALRDRVGAELPLRADAGCRNTVFNNRAQTGAEYVARLLELGARNFRVEFVNETAAEVAQTLTRYGQLLRGAISGADLWRELKLLNQLGVTRGQMEAAAPVVRRKT